MLRIGNGAPMPPKGPDASQAPPTPKMDQMSAMSDPALMTDQPDDSSEHHAGDGCQVSPDVARYFGPESRCEGCIHYLEGQGGGQCEIVSGPIDPQGLCMLFEGDEAESTDNPDEEAMEPAAE